MVRVWVVLVLLGCGRVGFDPYAPTNDGGDGGAKPDAGCPLFGPWDPPQRLVAISSSNNDWGGQISPDGLSYYFASNRSGDLELYESHRTDRNQSFTTVTIIPGVNMTATSEDDVSMSASALDIYFPSDRGPACLFHGSRATTAVPFSNITPLAFCGTQAGTGAYIMADDLALYYNTLGSFSLPWGTLLVSRRATTADPFPVGTPVPGLQGGEDKGFGVVTPDELTIYFETADPNHHVWQATRTDTSSAFANAVLIPGINGPNIDEDVSITADGLELFFASDRGGSLGGPDLFHATRTCMN